MWPKRNALDYFLDIRYAQLHCLPTHPKEIAESQYFSYEWPRSREQVRFNVSLWLRVSNRPPKRAKAFGATHVSLPVRRMWQRTSNT